MKKYSCIKYVMVAMFFISFFSTTVNAGFASCNQVKKLNLQYTVITSSIIDFSVGQTVKAEFKFPRVIDGNIDLGGELTPLLSDNAGGFVDFGGFMVVDESLAYPFQSYVRAGSVNSSGQITSPEKNYSIIRDVVFGSGSAIIWFIQTHGAEGISSFTTLPTEGGIWMRAGNGTLLLFLRSYSEKVSDCFGNFTS